MTFSSGASAFENVLGISSIDVTLKNRHSATGDGYPYAASPLDNSQNAKTYLNFEHAELIAKVNRFTFLQLVAYIIVIFKISVLPLPSNI